VNSGQSGRRAELRESIDRIEEAYEFMLAYAAQGVAGDATSGSTMQLRSLLERADEALTDLAAGFREVVDEEGLKPADPYRAFIAVLERDAADAQSALKLVLAQPAISSLLIDNLNASIHVRALLTDVFLIDEVLDSQVSRSSRTQAG